MKIVEKGVFSFLQVREYFRVVRPNVQGKCYGSFPNIGPGLNIKAGKCTSKLLIQNCCVNGSELEYGVRQGSFVPSLAEITRRLFSRCPCASSWLPSSISKHMQIIEHINATSIECGVRWANRLWSSLMVAEYWRKAKTL